MVTIKVTSVIVKCVLHYYTWHAINTLSRISIFFLLSTDRLTKDFEIILLSYSTITADFVTS